MNSPIDKKILKTISNAIFERLSRDIKDRRGIKHEWNAIDKDVMDEEIKPEWEKIIQEEIQKKL